MDAVRETFVEAMVSMRRPALKLVDK